MAWHNMIKWAPRAVASSAVGRASTKCPMANIRWLPMPMTSLLDVWRLWVVSSRPKSMSRVPAWAYHVGKSVSHMSDAEPPMRHRSELFHERAM